MTYAKIAEKLNKEYNKYDKNLQNAVTDAERNSAMMMLQRVSSRLNQLMVSNQNDANIADQQETAIDSPNQSIEQRTMRMAKNGGKTFPDLTGDGKTTYADVLKGRGVFGKGGSVSWMFGGKKYSGTLIPSKETSTHRYARTHNGKIKSLPKKEKGGSLKEIPASNTGLPELPKFVRNRMGYMQGGGRLYNDVTMEQIKEYMEEAGIISGLGDKFDPKNPEHVKKLQEGMLGAFTGPGADRMLSGTELEFIGPDGPQSVNQAGVDGKFGTDTFAALKQFTEMKNSAVPTRTPSLQSSPNPEIIGNTAGLEETAARLMDQDTSTGEDKGGEDIGGGKSFLKDTVLKSLPGLAKGLEYMNTYNTLNNMLPPPDLTLNRPQYLNTNVDISADLNALNEASLMRERALTDSSTKANNVRTNLAGQDAAFNKVRSKLFQDQRNKEMQLQNAQTAMNFKTEDENRKRIYDNAMNQRDFVNDQSRARRDFMSGVVGDVMDYTTQNTNRESQMARMNALMPYLNQFGVYDRAYDESFLNKYPFMRELLGLKNS